MRLALPSISKIGGGRVAYTYYDGQKSELHVLDVGRQTDETISVSEEVFHAVAVTADGAYVLVRDAMTRADMGIRFVSQGGIDRQVVAPRGGDSNATSASSVRVVADWLIVEDCTFSSCTVLSFDARTGVEIGRRALDAAGIAAARGPFAVASSGCALPCMRSALSIPDLSLTDLGLSCGSVAIANFGGAPSMVAGTAGDCSARGDQLIAISAQGMHDIGLASLADVRLVGESPRADVEVGGGQVVLSADGQLRPDDDVTIFDIASGLFAPGRIVVNRAVQPK